MTTTPRSMPPLPAGHWARDGFLVLDTETTGVDVETALVASISVGMMHPDQPLDIGTEYIAVDMPEAAGAVNGLTTEWLKAQATRAPAAVFARAAEVVARKLTQGVPLVIANAPFDLTVLDRECRRHGVPTITDRLPGTVSHPGPVVDPIVLDKRVVKYRRRVSETQGARQLITLAQVHGAGWDPALAHTSEYDAVQAGRVVWNLMRSFPTLARMSLGELHAAQVGWYAEQSEGLRGWFRSEETKRMQLAGQARRAGQVSEADALVEESREFAVKAASVDTAWPIRPFGGPPASGAVAGPFLPAVCEIPACGCSGLAHP